jgi:hypothetical protein
MGLDVEKLHGAVTIYRHRRSGAFRVQPMCRRGRFGLADAGQPVLVDPQNEHELARSVLQALDSFAVNRFEESAPGLSPKEQSRFLREHDAITVDRVDDELRVTPLGHVRGGFESNDTASVMLRDPITDAALVRAVREAFAQAT